MQGEKCRRVTCEPGRVESVGLSMWELYRESSRAGYLEPGSEGLKLLQRVLNQVERLPEAACLALLQHLVSIAGQVWRGSSTMTAELQSLQACLHFLPSEVTRTDELLAFLASRASRWLGVCNGTYGKGEQGMTKAI